MSIDWGIIGTIISVGSVLGSIYTYWKFRQIRKEELMTNIDIDFKYKQKGSGENKYLWGTILFKNIGRMNSMVSVMQFDFIPKTKELTLDFNKLILANDSLKFEIGKSEEEGINPYIRFDLTRGEFLKIDPENEDNMVYFNPLSPFWLTGLQIASNESFSEDFIIPYTGNGGLEVSITIHSFKRTRMSLNELNKWVNWYESSDNIYYKQAELEAMELEKICEDKAKVDVKLESFLLYLD
jgi:hypothetical protein